jgi:hypothetical protein
MWWTAVKILGGIIALLLALGFLALVVLVTRPVLITGVSADYLERSVGFTRVDQSCRKLSDGSWICDPVEDPPERYEVDWMGCWKTVPPITSGSSRSDCIDLDDIVGIN